MPTYSRQDRLAAAQNAGFPDPLTAVAVSLAEFGENRDINVQSQSDVVSGGVREPSFGPWQIHLPSHPNVAQSCAMDLTCSTKQAYLISNGGTDFSPWSSFNSGAHLPFLKELEAQFADLLPISPTPASGDTGPAGPSGGAAGAAPSTKPNPYLPKGVPMPSIPQLGSGKPLVDVPAEIGKKVADATSGLTGIAAAIKNVQNSFRAENLWRAAFIIVGAGAVFVGGRMYLKDGEAVPQQNAPRIA